MHERCSGIRPTPDQDNEFISQTCPSQKTDTGEECRGLELDSQWDKIVENVCYFVDTTGIRWDACLEICYICLLVEV